MEGKNQNSLLINIQAWSFCFNRRSRLIPAADRSIKAGKRILKTCYISRLTIHWRPVLVQAAQATLMLSRSHWSRTDYQLELNAGHWRIHLAARLCTSSTSYFPFDDSSSTLHLLGCECFCPLNTAKGILAAAKKWTWAPLPCWLEHVCRTMNSQRRTRSFL